MKNKYVMIEGLAFSEQSDMNKLSNYAKEGWLLDSIKGNMLYKLKKGEPQDIIYSVDYQYNADDEYFSLFKEAGWNHILTSQNSIHIFSAPTGTEPIYSDSDSEKSKYTTVIKSEKKGSIISGILSLIFLCLAFVSSQYIRQLLIPLLIVFIISLCIFILNFMPFIASYNRIKQIEKYGKCTDKDTEIITLYMINLFIGLGLLLFAIIEYVTKKRVATTSIVIALINIAIGLNFFDNKRKTKKDC